MYIGNQPTQQAFVTDTFNGNGSTTAFTMSVAPAGTTSVLVAVSGVLQDPSTYSVSGTTLTFSAAPPSGTGNISARYLGIPASGVTTTAYRTVTEFTATAGQTTFTPPSYTAGFINVYRNGVRLGSTDYTATNGTTVVLASGATAGDIVTVESYYVSSVLNAIPNTPNSIVWNNLPTGSLLQLVNATTSANISTTSTSFVTTGFSLSITPRFSNSKIMLFVNGGAGYSGTSTGAILETIYRNSTNLGDATNGLSRSPYGSNSAILAPHSMSVLDSPATTSSITYTCYFKSAGGNSVDFMASDRGVISFTAMEIAG